MLIYLSDNKIADIMDEIKVLKESFFLKYFEGATARLEISKLTIEGKIGRPDGNSTDFGVMNRILNYLKSDGKLHQFNKKTKILQVMHAYKITANLSIDYRDNPAIDKYPVFAYMIENPNEITTLTLSTDNGNFPIIKINCSNKNIWYGGDRKRGKQHLGTSLDIVWDSLLNRGLIVNAVVFVTNVDNESGVVLGSPLYINS